MRFFMSGFLFLIWTVCLRVRLPQTDGRVIEIGKPREVLHTRHFRGRYQRLSAKLLDLPQRRSESFSCTYIVR